MVRTVKVLLGDADLGGAWLPVGLGSHEGAPEGPRGREEGAGRRAEAQSRRAEDRLGEARKIASGKPCPEGLWSLFPTTAGEGAEQQANEAKRAKVKGQTSVVQLRHNQGVELRKYNTRKKQLLVEVEGLVECFNGAGLLSLARGDPAKPFRPKDEDEDDGNPPQSVWRAQPLLFPIPFDTAAEAKSFTEKDEIGTIARLVLTLGEPDVDTKFKKTMKPNGEAREDTLDWGAGRLVRVKLIGVRISSDFEKKLLAVRR
jgi:hypothetical protein